MTKSLNFTTFLLCFNVYYFIFKREEEKKTSEEILKSTKFENFRTFYLIFIDPVI